MSLSILSCEISDVPMNRIQVSLGLFQFSLARSGAVNGINGNVLFTSLSILSCEIRGYEFVKAFSVEAFQFSLARSDDSTAKVDGLGRKLSILSCEISVGNGR